jgi:hypothetical protein
MLDALKSGCRVGESGAVSGYVSPEKTMRHPDSKMMIVHEPVSASHWAFMGRFVSGHLPVAGACGG